MRLAREVRVKAMHKQILQAQESMDPQINPLLLYRVQRLFAARGIQYFQ
jgi:hypothetical protein